MVEEEAEAEAGLPPGGGANSAIVTGFRSEEGWVPDFTLSPTCLESLLLLLLLLLLLRTEDDEEEVGSNFTRVF